MKLPNTSCVRPMPTIQRLKNTVVFKIIAAEVTFREELQLLFVAAGAICPANFKTKGITIATHIASCKGIEDEPFGTTEEAMLQQADKLNDSYFPTISNQAEQEMIQVIEQAHSNGDSVGGILETAIVNMPAGIGEPFLVRLKVCWHIFCSVYLLSRVWSSG